MSKYYHKTYKQLTLDKIREIQFDIELVKDYLQYDGYADNSIIRALDDCSTLIFDDVYKPLKDIVNST